MITNCAWTSTACGSSAQQSNRTVDNLQVGAPHWSFAFQRQCVGRLQQQNVGESSGCPILRNGSLIFAKGPGRRLLLSKAVRANSTPSKSSNATSGSQTELGVLLCPPWTQFAVGGVHLNPGLQFPLELLQLPSHSLHWKQQISLTASLLHLLDCWHCTYSQFDPRQWKCALHPRQISMHSKGQTANKSPGGDPTNSGPPVRECGTGLEWECGTGPGLSLLLSPWRM